MQDSLINLGLSPTEAEIFETVVTIGPCFVAPIVHQTRKHRQIIYNALENLEERRLIAVTKKNGKNFYQVGDPDRLVLDVRQDLVLAKQVASHIKENLKHGRELAEVFEGPQSYEQGLADFRQQAGQAKEYIVIGGETKEWYEFNQAIFPSHVDELKKLRHRGVDIFILFYEAERNSAEQYIKPYLRDPYVCKIAHDDARLPHTSWLTGDHVYLLTPTVEPLVVKIKSRTLAGQYRDYFWKQWHQSEALK